VFIVKRSRPDQAGSVPGLGVLPGPAWYWRLSGSLMLLALLAAILVVRPGAAMAQAAKPSLNVAVIGDFYSYGYAASANPTLRLSAPPTLQALNQIQVANPGVQLNVTFLPVVDATKARLYLGVDPGTRLAAPPQINAVKKANIVIVGVGATNTGFTTWMKTVLFGGTLPSAKVSAGFMASFDNGSYLQSQSTLLSDIAARVSPGASIVTLGYPKVLPEQVPSGLSWWSPFSWTAISQQRADMANQLVSALNTANNEATSVVAVQHASLHFLYADISGALQGKGPFKPQRGKNDAASTSIKTSQPNSKQSQPNSKTSQPSIKQSQPNSKQQTIIGNDLLPYVGQAIDNELVAKGVTGSQNIPQITPTARWKLIVVVPVELGPEKTRQAKPSSGAAVSPRNNVAYPQQPRQVPGDVSPSISVPAGISVPSAATGPQRQGDHSRSHTDTGQPAATPQPGGTGQPAATPQPGGTGQPSATPRAGGTGQPSATPAPASAGQPAMTSAPAGVDQPATTSAPAGVGQPATTPGSAGVGQPAAAPAPASAGQPAATPLPAGAGLPAAIPAVSCTFAEIATCPGQDLPPGHGGAPASPPVMAVPPAPLPPPITPSQSPDPTANPASPNPASPNPASQSPDGTGATTTPAGGATTTPAGGATTTPAGGATTTPAGGATATDGGAAVVTPGGATSATAGAASTLGGAASVQSVTPPAPVTSTQAAAFGGA
jgi:hypothetical protein